ncbi:PAS domain-containing hybrid sensor histidine kinase/response regulator [Rhizobacter sp. Root1221]|uniref:ATP-binding response regulator n=1 Tax=Rhizobacter sp. Root1221 TaxID=1736433 RepID=UPI0006FB2ED6|nr:PAS domain-containing hybrid sensor histidine kinase/response regulator [Rhizobacter sp. Root1221]KQV97536.1 hypothetical protein ASC87_22990 [Rhizobacter sp. Root1221]
MTDAETRVLVLAPWGRDAAVIQQVLAQAGLATVNVPTPGALVAALDEGAGTVFITEEALTGPVLTALQVCLAAQPPWSDLPLVVLAGKHGGANPARARATLEQLGNVVLLERPLHAESLSSAARSALRGRYRQYETRRHLGEQRLAATETARLSEAARRAKEATRQATETFAFAQSAAQLGTFHCPVPTTEVEWNATCRTHFWLGQDGPGSISIDDFRAIVHPEDRQRLRNGMDDAVDRREPFDIEFRTVSPDGQWRWLRAKGMAYGPAGQPATRFDGITIDISAQKALEVQREELLAAERLARRDAERASRMKDEFLATLSHELRTPLAAIIGWTSVLRRSATSTPEIARAVDTIERNARTQARLIDDLLDMSRIISGKVRLDVDLLDLGTLTDTVLASLEPTAQAKRLSVVVQRSGTVPLVRGDANRLQQVVWNLLSNAFKFTPADGRVTVRLAATNDEVALVVEDSGQGISAAFLPFVFDRFRQSDASTTRMHGGLGLGLSIVKNLVELHRGTVEARSDGPGRGACFTIRLPACTGDLLDSPSATTGPDAVETPCAAAGHDLSGLRILVVDDEPDLNELLQHELENCGAVVYAVGTSAAAIELVTSHHPHLLISDIGMPDEDGYALLRRIRALGPEAGGDIPAIALTALAGPEDRARALASGFATHIAKPVDMVDLLDEVVEVLRRTHATAI